LPPGVEIDFLNAELLHLPRADGVLLTLVPAEPVELQVEYGLFPAKTRLTPISIGRAGELAIIDLDGLRPGTRYQYQVSVRRPGDAFWTARELHGFRTLAMPGQPLRFAVAADTHAWAVYSKFAPVVGGPTLAFHYLRSAVDRLELVADDLDFLVLGTDVAMIECGGCLPKQASVGFVSGGSANDLADAKLRYEWVFGEELLGAVGSDLPLILGLGDHDGELGWDPELYQIAADARRSYLPDPGEWFSWRSGDVLFVMLNVSAATGIPPAAPEDWTLGTDQLMWLARTLATSDAPLKIVMAEHLMGGHSGPDTPNWKARGGLRATDTGLPDGDFLGEQRLLHDLFVQHDVNVFLSFHDHVVVHGVKDGVTYLIGGRASGVGNKWTDKQWYRDAMDYDLDGVPEFETDITGTVQPGIFEVTVSDGVARFDYVLASPDPLVDGSVLLSYEVFGRTAESLVGESSGVAVGRPRSTRRSSRHSTDDRGPVVRPNHDP